MTNEKSLMTSMAIAVLVMIPGLAMAQVTPGEEDFVDVGPVGVTDETLKVHNDISLFWQDDDELIENQVKADFWDDHYVDSYSSIYPTGEMEICFEDVHKDELDQISQTLQNLYPGSNLIVRPVCVQLDAEIKQGLPDETQIELDALTPRTFTHARTVNHTLVNNGDTLETIDTINVTEHIVINGMRLIVTINHEDHDELNGYLEDPDGNLHRIFVRPRGIDDGSHTWNVQLSNPAFSNLQGTDAFGTWKLKVGDYSGGSDTGSVVSWRLTIAGTAPASTDSHSGSDTGLFEASLLDRIDDFFNTFLNQGVDKSCSFITDDCLPTLAGMPVGVLLETSSGTHNAHIGSIGLGGVQTNDGMYGFIAPYHVVTSAGQDQPVFQEIDRRLTTEHLLGSVETITVLSDKKSDAVFVKYPMGCSAIESTHSLCIESVPYVPIVEPLKIYKGNRQAYDVTGEATLSVNQALTWVGQSSGKHTGIYQPMTMDINVGDGNTVKGHFVNVTTESQSGDSGGPMFVVTSDGNAEIAGFVIGHDTSSSINRIYMTSWADVKTDLDLKSIL